MLINQLILQTVYLDSLEIVARKGVEIADLGQHAIRTPGSVQMDVKPTWSPLFVQVMHLNPNNIYTHSMTDKRYIFKTEIC